MLKEDQNFEKYAKLCNRSMQNALKPYEYEWTCVAFGQDVRKRKIGLTRIQRKRNKFYQWNKLFRVDNLYLN